MNLSDAYTDFLLDRKGRHASRNYLDLLNRTCQYWLARWSDAELTTITPEQIRLWLAWLMGNDDTHAATLKLSSAAMYVHYRNLKAFLLWCEREEYLPIQRAPIRKVERPRVSEREPDLLEPEEVNAILKAVKNSGHKNSFRDYVVHLFFASTGARLKEVSQLNWDDVNLAHQYAKVKGKGGKERLVPLSVELARALLKYKRLHRLPAAAPDADAVFTNEQGGRLKADGLRTMVVRDIRANITRPLCKLGPHSYRRYTATMMLEELPIGDVKDILGHADIKTTLRYRKKSALRVVEGANARNLSQILQITS